MSMRSGQIPFKLDLQPFCQRATQRASSRVGNVTVRLPFVSFTINPKDVEKRVAAELVIRLRDRRVLSSFECCDNCIDDSLKSLAEIRKTLVDKQVELSELKDGPLFLLLDAMAMGIRQFMTFEERLKAQERPRPEGAPSDFYRDPDTRQAYFDGLELLRGHLSRCLGQIAVIAGEPEFRDGVIAGYQGDWQLEAYTAPSES
jgi:hypothetical protein